ncbi:MAG: glycosyltransferase domain-containing protein [Rhodoglobus sp.]
MVQPSDEVPVAPPRRVVFTALIGDYEALNEQPAATDSDVEFICFTDNLEITSESWQLRHVEPRYPLDNIRSARYLKVHGPELLTEFSESLWIDNSVLLKSDPARLLDAWLESADFALPRHSYRTSVIGEFDAVATQGYDDPARVYEQLIHYSTLRPEVLRERPYWTAMLARRQTESVIVAMQLWLEHVLRYSRRDQLSINFVLAESGIAVRGIELDNWTSEWHQWPHIGNRRWSVTHDRLASALRIPSADIGKLENAVQALTDKVESLTGAADDERKLAETYRTSVSWIVTRPFRVLWRAVARK